MDLQISCGAFLMTLVCVSRGHSYVYSHGSSHKISWGDDDSLEAMGDTAVPQYDIYFGSKGYEHKSSYRQEKDTNGRDLAGDYTFYEPTSLNIRSYDKSQDAGSFSIHTYDHGLQNRDHHHDHGHHGHHDGHGEKDHGHGGGHHHGHEKHHEHDGGHHHEHGKHHGHDGGHHHGHDGGDHHGHHGDHHHGHEGDHHHGHDHHKHHHHGHHDYHKHK